MLSPAEDLKSAGAIRGMTKVNFMTVAKIGLSSVDGGPWRRTDRDRYRLQQRNFGRCVRVQPLGFGYAHLSADYHQDGTPGSAAGAVGSDDKVTVTFEITVPTFMPGGNNHICVVDGEGRMSDYGR